MSNLILNTELISQLNNLLDIPIPLVAYIFTNWLKARQGLPNRYHHPTILKTLRNQHITIDYQIIAQNLEFMFIAAKKQQLTTKQINIFLNQNTLLSQSHTALVLSLYEQFQVTPSGSIPSKGRVEWSAVSLRQSETGNRPNKLYMKVQVTVDSLRGCQKRTLTMTLLQFRLWLQQMRKVESLL